MGLFTDLQDAPCCEESLAHVHRGTCRHTCTLRLLHCDHTNPLSEPVLISLIFDSYLAVSREEQSFLLCNSY